MLGDDKGVLNRSYPLPLDNSLLFIFVASHRPSPQGIPGAPSWLFTNRNSEKEGLERRRDWEGGAESVRAARECFSLCVVVLAGSTSPSPARVCHYTMERSLHHILA